jgi:hypothetical protein
MSFAARASGPPSSAAQLPSVVSASGNNYGIGASASAQFDIFNTGTWETNATLSFTNSGTWLESGSSSNFEIRLSPTSGSFSGSAVNTWLSLSTNRAWYVDVTLVSGFSAANDAYGVIEFRSATTQALLFSGTLSLNSTVIDALPP